MNDPDANWNLYQIYFQGQGVPINTTKVTIPPPSPPPPPSRTPALSRSTSTTTITTAITTAPLSLHQASGYLRRAAKLGLAKAQHNLGVQYDEEGDYDASFLWFRKAAEQSYPEVRSISPTIKSGA